jgi:hypothetical protein
MEIKIKSVQRGGGGKTAHAGANNGDARFQSHVFNLTDRQSM